MKTACLLMIAIGMIACTHSRTTAVAGTKNSSIQKCVCQNATALPVVSNKPAQVADAAPDLPFFKDLFDSKRLFW